MLNTAEAKFIRRLARANKPVLTTRISAQDRMVIDRLVRRDIVRWSSTGNPFYLGARGKGVLRGPFGIRHSLTDFGKTIVRKL